LVIDGKRADDPNGPEFNDILEARVEAIAAARHVMGDWLRHQSGPLPEWLVQIVDANNACQSALNFDPPYCLSRECYPSGETGSRGGLPEGGRSPTDGSPPTSAAFFQGVRYT
jgi:Domain of unknown function (DUF6894)